MPLRVCLTPGCGNLVARGYCPECGKAREPQRLRSRDADARARNRLYGSKRWALTRRKKLNITPLCEKCGDIANEVHHRVALEAGGAPHAMSNLESLCKPCHSSATRAEQLARY